jgi:hypothetical protein
MSPVSRWAARPSASISAFGRLPAEPEQGERQRPGPAGRDPPQPVSAQPGRRRILDLIAIAQAQSYQPIELLYGLAAGNYVGFIATDAGSISRRLRRTAISSRPPETSSSTAPIAACR